MRNLQGEGTQVMRIAIQQGIGRAEQSRYDHPLHELSLAAAGQLRRQVADQLGEDGT